MALSQSCLTIPPFKDKPAWVLVEETVVDPYIDEWVLMKALDPWNTHVSPQMKPNALISYFYVIIYNQFCIEKLINKEVGL